MTPLHRTATTSVDTHLFKLLCENGANINALDGRGNSPLLAMCDVLATEDYDFFEDWSTTSDDTYEDTNTTFSVQHDFLDYMLSLKTIQVSLSL
jgi:ankyrin repeat protein